MHDALDDFGSRRSLVVPRKWPISLCGMCVGSLRVHIEMSPMSVRALLSESSLAQNRSFINHIVALFLWVHV